jgi:hypothetical protein
MKLQKAVVNETKTILIGSLIGTAVMLAVFAVIGKFSMGVIWGTLLGLAAAVGNFFMMALMVQKATESELPGETEDERTGRIRRMVQLSYTQRRLFQAGVVIVAMVVPAINWIPTVIELIFPTVTIYLRQILINRRASERTDKPNG